MVLLLFSRFNWHFSRSFHNNSILLNASVSFGAAWQMPVWCCQFDCFLKQLNSTCVCCFLLLLLLFLLNDLLKQFCYVYLCRSMKKAFQGQEGSQCDAFLLQFRTMMPACSRVNDCFHSEWTASLLLAMYIQMHNACLLKTEDSILKELICLVDVKICFPFNVK